jgi:prepilin-type N-terminal cleavage/methylation domain-containing protein
MTHHPRLPRRAFTLIELLVAMGVIVLLASISVMVIGNINDNDRTVDGASLVRQYLMIAKSRAARDQAPRGVRFVVSVDPDNVAKNTNTQWVTELQYIEKASVYIPQPVQPPAPNPPIGPTDPGSPQVVFSYALAPGPIPQQGSVLPPIVTIQNISQNDVALIQPGSLLSLFNLGFSARVLSVGAPNPPPPANPTNIVVNLDFTPDANLGASGLQPFGTPIPVYTAFQFGITTPARPLLGEPAVQLPRNICVDLMSSSITGASTPTGVFNPIKDFDIVFLPSGQIDPNCDAGPSNQCFLWVRDYTKNGGNPAAYPGAVYSQGGEQQIASLKAKTGSLGTFPVAWTATPFEFAVLGATTP